MDTPQNFRSAFNGFNRDDVVDYISYLTTKHETEMGELRGEVENLTRELSEAQNSVPDGDLQQALEDLQQAVEERDSRIEEASGENENLRKDNAEQMELLDELQKQVNEQREEMEKLHEQLHAEHTRCEQLQLDLEQAKQFAHSDGSEPVEKHSWNEELNAYRRAESTERRARERVARMYDNANAVLADATAKVDASSVNLGELADQFQKDLDLFRAAIADGGQALADAVVSLGAIRPEED